MAAGKTVRNEELGMENNSVKLMASFEERKRLDSGKWPPGSLDFFFDTFFCIKAKES